MKWGLSGKTAPMTDHLVALGLIALLATAFAAVGGEFVELVASAAR